MKINLLHVYRTYYPDPPGGVQEAIRQICLSTSKLNIDNTIFALSTNPEPKSLAIDNAAVYREKSWLSPSSCDIGGYSAFNEFVKLSKKNDILQYHFPWPFFDCLNLFSSKSKPKIITYHSDIVKQRFLGKVYAPLMWKTLASMDVIVATSPKYVETSSVLSHPSVIDRVRVIPLGINESSYNIRGDDSVFSRISLDSSEPFFLFLGVHRYYKGIHSLIEAAKFTKAKIVIGGSGPLTLELKRLAHALDVTNIIFSGQLTDPEKLSLFKSCRAFVLPSHLRSEAFGVVLIEASMMGKPMITCEIGTGTTYVNINDITGLVVPPESPRLLANAINTLLENESVAKNMGVNARQRYEHLFSGNVLGKAYEDLYRELA